MDLMLSQVVLPTVVDHTKVTLQYRINRSTTVEEPETVDKDSYKLIMDVVKAVFGASDNPTITAHKLMSKIKNLRKMSLGQYTKHGPKN